jgi:dTDP-4-dehydrorhamnose reductase
MLGTELVTALDGHDVTGLTRAQLDITDATSVDAAVAGHDVVINAAAWTDVDGAETQESAAAAINADGPAHLARACVRHGARLLHVSTDYVFSGRLAERGGTGADARPYGEDESTEPGTAYGRTKLAGEQAVLKGHPDGGYVVRTAWLYGVHGRNFVRTMLELERTKPTLDVVDDQWGQPTWTGDLAPCLIALGTADAAPGTYHATGSGRTTWFGLARAVFEAVGADPERVRPTTTDRFPRPAPRPAFSVLGADGLRRLGIVPMPPWRDSLLRALPALQLG